MFTAGHQIILNDGTKINNLEDWLDLYQQEMKRIQNCISVKTAYKEIDKVLNKNVECKRLKDAIKDNPKLILLLADISKLKKDFWKNYLSVNASLLTDITSKLKLNKEKIERIIAEANKQKDL